MWNGEGLLTGKGSVLGAVPDSDSSCAGSVEGTAMIDSTILILLSSFGVSS